GMMMLIALAISVAFFYSAATVIILPGADFFWELATLIDVMLFGHWIEAKSVLGASRALEELVKLMPVEAHLIMDSDKIINVKVSSLKPGDIVLVRPGEKIPSDGIVVDGLSFVNEALMTGESKPIRKEVGSLVIGGSINQEGMLKVKIDKTGEDTYLSQVIKLVDEAQKSKSKTQDLANRAAALLFYVALTGGILSFIIWSFISPSFFAIERSVTVLVIACPHALGLAIPLVVAVITTKTSINGILVRNRIAFENIRKINIVVFDKTGTLTTGEFGVTDVIPFIDETEFLKLTAALEINSEHIIAQALIKYVQDKGLEIPKSQSFNYITGVGTHGVVFGKEVYTGGQKLLEQLKIKVEDKRVLKLVNQGKTVIYTIVDGELTSVIALSDKIRPESYKAVQTLKEMGIKVYMITGDSNQVAEAVSSELGIENYFAQVLPKEKAEKIKQLKEQGYIVAMVGDGINDAPALVTADVGIAIGAGIDVAIESADIILVKNNPLDVIKTIKFSRKTFSKMIQNL
ncbi:MAG: heavy metal translocating P-type ATPase, partial [Candidatus Odinarchaeia archaeon]